MFSYSFIYFNKFCINNTQLHQNGTNFTKSQLGIPTVAKLQFLLLYGFKIPPKGF